MANLNKVFLIGNLTRDIDLRYAQSGTAIAKLGMAINRKFTTNGESRESTCFLDLTAFGRQAEVLQQYLSKGSPLFVEGRLEYSTWEAKEGGGKRSKVEVIIENFQFLGGRASEGGGGGGGDGGASRSARPQQGREQAQGEQEVDYGDIPF